jgi:cytoskeletal protein CcmA (bactofilin family)
MWAKPNEGATQNMPSQSNSSGNTPNATSNSNSSPTVFGKTMKIVGEVSSDEELQLDGELEGNLNLKGKLTIGPASKVNANIKAREVVIYGTVKGNVEAENRISLRAGASIVGDIKTAGIVIEDGAYFKGGIDISRVEPEKTVPQAAGAVAGQKR